MNLCKLGCAVTCANCRYWDDWRDNPVDATALCVVHDDVTEGTEDCAQFECRHMVLTEEDTDA